MQNKTKYQIVRANFIKHLFIAIKPIKSFGINITKQHHNRPYSMFNPYGGVVQTLTANWAATECESSPRYSRCPESVYRKDHAENHFVSKEGAPETKDLVPTL